MDGLSAAASIIQVIQISEQVISTCYQYYRSVKGAKKDILNIINHVGGLKSTLESLRLLIDSVGDPADPRLPHLVRLDVPLKSCQSELQSIANKLHVNPAMNFSLADVKVSIPRQLTWPWKEKEVEKILAVIEKQKTIFILALGGDTLQAVLSIQDTVETFRNTTSSIQETVAEVLTSSENAARSKRHSKVLDWIKVTDPSSNHNAARKKHQPTTGEWFLQSGQFVAWLEGRIPSIWVHGIPGAGKTILCSTVIDHVAEFCNPDSRQRHAYFYFDFNDANKRTVTGMLRSILQQLSAVNLCPELDRLYQQCGEGNHEPRLEALVETLISVLSSSDRKFLLLDALDECSERDELLDVIARILTESQVGVLATSRNERNIAESLQVTVANITCLGHDDGVADDISLHVQRCLQEDKRLKGWPQKIKQEIQKALIDGAHGMFRWVECQLEALRNCLTVYSVRNTLRNLPPTLDATYDRILINIPQEYRREAHCALQLLTVSRRPLKLYEVAEAVAVDPEREIFDPENRLRDPGALLEICSSLLIVSGNELRFAHYSVHEYLVSDRISQRTSYDFGTVEREAHRLYARVLLIYFLSVIEIVSSLRKRSFSRFELDEMFPLLPYASCFWADHLRRATIEGSHGPDFTLTKRLFHPASYSLFVKIWRLFWFPDGQENYEGIAVLGMHGTGSIYVKDGTEFEYGGTLSEQDNRLFGASYLGLTHLIEWLAKEGADVNADSGGIYHFPLIIASRAGHEGVVRLLLDLGAEIEAKNDFDETALTVAVIEGHEAVARMLLDEGARLEGSGKSLTALQGAVISGNDSLVRPLIERGADVNAFNDNGETPLITAVDRGHLTIVRLLLENGAQINATYDGESALHAAASSGDLEIVQLLLDRGADVNGVGERGVLQCTARGAAWHNNYMSTAQLLLDYGANVNVTDGDGGSALQEAKDTGREDLVRLLLENGA